MLYIKKRKEKKKGGGGVEGGEKKRSFGVSILNLVIVTML